ncbi:serine/threonine protein kinase, putative [Babesia bigemina]|uniref:Serine/threonine protein kinase, putative n=1 Tax=Babesia bigemina TaxID=5866 RepID=A0A061DC10_BABBI|nr:serine/threonine protein kinase, putative [Babesia bigemina]CDR97532.1 serine/threonine protein kinase, putative [Babesia bigemina]|eukprot:XP_012769718.1 serine/threonine protein kinase, putative [Babesia bigemina]
MEEPTKQVNNPVGSIASVVRPLRSDVRGASSFVGGAQDLQHGITSIDTMSTYRSDIYNEILADVKDQHGKVAMIPNDYSLPIGSHANDCGSFHSTMESDNHTGCRYTRCSVVRDEKDAWAANSTVLPLNRHLNDKRDGIGVNYVRNADDHDPLLVTGEAFASLNLKCNSMWMHRNANSQIYNVEGSKLKPSTYLRRGLVSPQFHKPGNLIFRHNKYDKDALTSNKGCDVELSSSPTRCRDASTSPNDTPFLQSKTSKGFFWHKPFGVSRKDKVMFFRGLPYVETLNPGVQKSWHLEAISALTRDQYASLKMTMFRLSNGSTNLDPKLLLILSSGSWEVLQEGTFGTVYIGCVEGMGNCAVKVPVSVMVQQDPVGVMRRYINEWDILSRCDHPNIVKLRGGLIFGVFDIWLCTELIRGADLHSIKYGEHTKRFISPKVGLKMCRQLADAILYLHTPTEERGKIVHRDIKPENIIVLPNWDIKLCDFGDACENSDGNVDNISGATWLYAPPELLTHKSIMVDIVGLEGNARRVPNELSEKWDIWSMGCVFQEMFGYSGPFHYLVDAQDKPARICEKMVASAIKGLVPHIPHALAHTRMGQLIAQCLQNDPNARPSAAQICAMLRVPDTALLQ